MAIGSVSEDPLTERLKNIVAEVITVGDAVKVRKAMEAIEEGFSYNFV